MKACPAPCTDATEARLVLRRTLLDPLALCLDALPPGPCSRLVSLSNYQSSCQAPRTLATPVPCHWPQRFSELHLLLRWALSPSRCVLPMPSTPIDCFFSPSLSSSMLLAGYVTSRVPSPCTRPLHVAVNQKPSSFPLHVRYLYTASRVLGQVCGMLLAVLS